MKRLRQSLFNAARHDGRGARALVVAAVLGGAFLLVRPSLPTAMRITFQLPEGVRSLEVEYRQGGGAVVRSARFTWPDDSPSLVRHEPELTAGPYRIVATTRDRGGRATVVRRQVALDADRLVRVDLRERRTDP